MSTYNDDNEIKQSIKDFWNKRPCNILHSKKEFGTREYFDEVEYKKYFVEPHIPNFASFNTWKGKKVLEIGGGIGTDSINFARNGAILTIIEFSDKSLEVIKQRFKVYNLNATFILGDVEKLSDILPIQDFDLIYSFGVIHHTNNPDKAFEQISKYMNKDTELRVMLYSKVSFKLFWIMMENDVKEINKGVNYLVRQNAEAQFGCPVAYTYTFDEIRDMISKYGISIENIWKDHIFSYDIENYKNNIYIKDMYWKNVDEKLFKEFEKDLGWHTLFVAKKI